MSICRKDQSTLPFQPRSSQRPPSLPSRRRGTRRPRPSLKPSRRGRPSQTSVSGRLIPNQAVLISSSPPAQASSQSKGIIIDHRPAAVLASGRSGRPGDQGELRYPHEPCTRGFQMLGERPGRRSSLSGSTARSKGVDLGVRSTPGTALMSDATGAIPTPAGARDLSCAASSPTGSDTSHRPWRSIADRLAADFTYQFEAIHPFSSMVTATRVSTEPPIYLVDQGAAGYPSALPQPAHHPEQSAVLSVSARGLAGPGSSGCCSCRRRWSTAARTTTGSRDRDLLEQTAGCATICQDLFQELAELIFVNPPTRISDLDHSVSPRAPDCHRRPQGPTVSKACCGDESRTENLYINPAPARPVRGRIARPKRPKGPTPDWGCAAISCCPAAGSVRSAAPPFPGCPESGFALGAGMRRWTSVETSPVCGPWGAAITPFPSTGCQIPQRWIAVRHASVERVSEL